MLVLNPFTIDCDCHAMEHGIYFDDVSLTVQADAEKADINYIVRQFGLTHHLPYGLAVPVYDDFSDAPSDFQTALNYVLASKDVFNQMPATVRSRFLNDPAVFLDFVNDSANREEAMSLGLVPRPLIEPEAVSPEAVPPG